MGKLGIYMLLLLIGTGDYFISLLYDYSSRL